MIELVSLLETNGTYNRDRIKSIKIVNQNQIEVLVSIGQFFPDIKIGFVYNYFDNGKLYLNVISNGGIKMLMGLLNELGNNPKNFINIDKTRVSVDINGILATKLKGVKIKDMNIVGEQIYITMNINCT
jgi:hypothetical protein